MNRTYTVTITHTGDTPDEFDVIFRQYLTRWDSPFLEDYGPGDQDEGRDDGYEGPFVTDVTVTPATTNERNHMNHATFRHHNLVLTVSYSPSTGYEVLVEVDTDEAAAGVPVSIGHEGGTIAEVVL